jgi:predicted DNA-binding ribbon-helix-helix protein
LFVELSNGTKKEEWDSFAKTLDNEGWSLANLCKINDQTLKDLNIGSGFRVSILDGIEER